MKIVSPLPVLLTLTVANALAWGVPNTRFKLSEVKPLSMRFACNAPISGGAPSTAADMGKSLKAALQGQP